MKQTQLNTIKVNTIPTQTSAKNCSYSGSTMLSSAFPFGSGLRGLSKKWDMLKSFLLKFGERSIGNFKSKSSSVVSIMMQN